jgi:signal transduction histidine kinase
MRCAAPKPASLSSRLLTTTAIVLALISGVVVLAMALLLQWAPQALIEGNLERHAERVADGLHFNAAGMPDGVAVNDTMEAIYDALKLDAAYRILDRDGTVLISSDRATTAYAPEGSFFDPTLPRFELLHGGKLLHVLTTPFMHDGHQFYVQIMRSERMHKLVLGSDSKKVQTIVLVSALVAMLLFSFVVVATLHHMLKPLRKASAATAQIQPDNLSARLSLDGVPAELIPLFNSFNLALQRLDEGYRIQREFLATAAHELKTPLALIRGEIELEHADKGRDCSGLLRDLDHMARQVHQLLHLAEASERQNYAMEQVDANEVASEAVAQLERLAQRREVRVVHAAGDDPVMVEADRGALFVLMRNLIENAIHHAPSDSAVEVEISHKEVTVRDYGAGIADEAMPLLFKRFWRSSHRRDEGAGLGLSICEEIARAHGWTLGAQNAGLGALFTVGFGGADVSSIRQGVASARAEWIEPDSHQAPTPNLRR